MDRKDALIQIPVKFWVKFKTSFKGKSLALGMQTLNVVLTIQSTKLFSVKADAQIFEELST